MSKPSSDVAKFVMYGRLVSSQPRRHAKLTLPPYTPHWYDRFIEPLLFLGMFLCYFLAYLFFMISLMMVVK